MTSESGHLKTCVKCGETKSRDLFRLVKNARTNRRRTDCIRCETAYKQKPEYKAGQAAYYKSRRTSDLQKKKEREQARAYGQTVNGRARRLYLAAKHRATKQNLDFNLIVERIIYSLLIGCCERTGLKFDLSSPNETQFNMLSPSIDRKNPFKGYTNENIQVVCNAYNLGKGQLTDEQFIAFCQTVVSYNDK